MSSIITGEFNLIKSIVDKSGERGRLDFNDGTQAYWEVDGPYYIRHTDGTITKEWTEDRAAWNTEPMTGYGEYLELVIPEGHGPEMQMATEEEDLDINETIDEARWPGENHQIRRIDARWELMKLAINQTGIEGQHPDWAEGLDQIEATMKQLLQYTR